MRLSPGKYVLDVDADRTRAYCRGVSGIGCDCAGCRNYARAAGAFPEAVRSFLERLGLAPEKPAEAYVIGAEADGAALLYGGFYHLCGAIVRGAPDALPLAAGYRVWFEEECDLLADDFPRPAFQMEIEFRVPWVLEEDNTYR